MSQTTEPFDLLGELPIGTCVLEASAGTGKTYTITALAIRYLAEGRFELEQIMMVTFSRAATGELRSRMHERLRRTVEALEATVAGEPLGRELDEVERHLFCAPLDEVLARRDRLREALADIDRATIATTHEFCQRMLVGLGMLGDHDEASHFAEDVSDLALQACQDVWLADELAAGSEQAPHKLASWERFRELGLEATLREPTAELAPADAQALTARRIDFARRVREQFERRKRRAGVYTFDDMIERLRQALTDAQTGPAAVAALSERFRLVLIDEFQDTDPAQWEIVRTAFVGQSTVVLIGDPKQAIYAFRGAEVNAYLEAVGSATQNWTLPTNYRSDRGVVQAIHDIFAEQAMGSAQIVAHRVDAWHQQARLRRSGDACGPAVQIRCLPGDRPRPHWQHSPAVDDDLVAEVVDLLGGQWEVAEPDPQSHQGQRWRPLEPHDIAVLVRSNRRGERIHRALVAANVAAVFSGSSPVMGSPAARDWLTVLQALVDPQHASMKKACLTSLFGWTEADLAAAVREEPGLPAARTLPALAVEVKTLSRVLAQQGVAAVFESLCEHHRLLARVLAAPGGDRLLTDLRHVCQLLNEAATRGELSPAALTAWLGDRVDEATANKVDDRTRRLETDRSCVQVMTVHAAKGLEFPVVLLPDAASHWLPDDQQRPQYMHQDGVRVLDVGIDRDRARRWAAHQAEEQAEELRILYVAMTRAKSRLLLWWTPSRDNTAVSPLHRLLHGPRVTGAQPEASYPLDPPPTDLPVPNRQLASVVTIEPRQPQPLPNDRNDERALVARQFDRPIDRTWRRTSYSGLTAEAHGLPALLEAHAGNEVDEVEPQDLAEVTIEAPPPDSPSSALAPLPGGVHFGTLVHAVLELVDPAAGDLSGELARVLAPLSARLPIEGMDDQALVLGLEQVMHTPLGPLADGLSLAQIGLRDRLAELDFELPMGSASHAATLADLAGALQDDELSGGDQFAARYGHHLAASGIADKTLRGFLTGSIDAVLRLPSGRHLVVDYKTNRLPSEGELTSLHYSRAAMEQAMVEAHYPLQALLYSVALHRFLGWRLPGYAPEQHLGGIGYLFVRGMAGPQTPVLEQTPCGVFTWRPSTALVLRLSQLIGGAR